MVLVRGYKDDKYYRDMYQLLNGIVLPGGELDLLTSECSRVAYLFMSMAKEEFDRCGEYFPIWGVCQGYHQLAIFAADMNADVLTETNTYDLALPLELYGNWRSSRLLGGAPNDVIKVWQTEDITSHNHKFSLTTKTFTSNPALNRFFKIISTNIDKHQEFVSTFEAIKYPWYGLIWHPEMNVYAWKRNLPIKCTPSTRSVSQYFANFLVDEARRSGHREASYEQACCF